MNPYTIITFPELNITLDPSKGIDLGPVHIAWYGAIIACGMVLAVLYALRRREEFGLTEDHLIDGVLCVVPFAILCARLYYCVFEWDTYASNPISVLYIWQGGLAIYGGILGAAVGMLVYCKWKRISFFATTDLVSLGFLIGQSAGRWGNFFNREAFGGKTDSFLRMGLFNTLTQEFEYHHPTFLYESVWNLVGLALLHWFSKRRQYDGQVSLLYVAWYGLGRAWIEGLRTDSLYIGSTGIRVSQLLSVVLALVSLTLLLIQSRKEHPAEKLFVNRTPEAEDNNHSTEEVHE
jgi:phosphatidylglycerol:prolipoprotein diacylglycerol transferase